MATARRDAEAARTKLLRACLRNRASTTSPAVSIVHLRRIAAGSRKPSTTGTAQKPKANRVQRGCELERGSEKENPHPGKLPRERAAGASEQHPLQEAPVEREGIEGETAPVHSRSSTFREFVEFLLREANAVLGEEAI